MGPIVHDHKAVFLDRDGVVNRLVYRPEFGILDSPIRPSELALLPGVPAAVAALNHAGFAVLIVTNQPGIAKATLPSAALEELHRLIRDKLAAAGGWLDGIYVCPHHPDGVIPGLAVTCDCRKPAPGLLLRAAAELGLDLRSSYMIGDGDIDVMAGRAAGATTFLLANLKPCLAELLDARETWPDHIVPDLPAAADAILARTTAAEAVVARTTHARTATHSQQIGTNQPVATSAAFVEAYLRDARRALDSIDRGAVRAILDELIALKRRGGKLFVLHVGQAVGHPGPIATGFDQLNVVEAVHPVERAGHQGCGGCGNCTGPSPAGWLDCGGLESGDLLLIVGIRGDKDDTPEPHDPEIIYAMQCARQRGAQVCAFQTTGGRHAAEARVALLGLLTSHPEIGVATNKDLRPGRDVRNADFQPF